MPRAIWKGAITFGLVHIPVGLYPASRSQDIDFDWLDRRSMDPVGYKRVNKRTGREIAREEIVKGIEYESGQYVLLSDEEIRQAYPRTTQTIEIEGFVDGADIPFAFLDTPYFLAPAGRGAEKVYVLLRESLRDSGRAGIARVVIRTKQHLAALMPAGEALVLNTLRWADEMRDAADLDLPASGAKAPKLQAAERKMAAQLIESMAVDWEPGRYADAFRDAVMTLVERKVESGETEEVEPLEEPAPAADRSNVVDLTELLRRSLGRDDGEKRGPTRARSPGKARTRSPGEADKPARRATSSRSGKSSRSSGSSRKAAAPATRSGGRKSA